MHTPWWQGLVDTATLTFVCLRFRHEELDGANHVTLLSSRLDERIPCLTALVHPIQHDVRTCGQSFTPFQLRVLVELRVLAQVAEVPARLIMLSFRHHVHLEHVRPVHEACCVLQPQFVLGEDDEVLVIGLSDHLLDQGRLAGARDTDHQDQGRCVRHGIMRFPGHGLELFNPVFHVLQLLLVIIADPTCRIGTQHVVEASLIVAQRRLDHLTQVLAFLLVLQAVWQVVFDHDLDGTNVVPVVTFSKEHFTQLMVIAHERHELIAADWLVAGVATVEDAWLVLLFQRFFSFWFAEVVEQQGHQRQHLLAFGALLVEAGHVLMDGHRGVHGDVRFTVPWGVFDGAHHGDPVRGSLHLLPEGGEEFGCCHCYFQYT